MSIGQDALECDNYQHERRCYLKGQMQIFYQLFRIEQFTVQTFEGKSDLRD
jgi:hypothetical protein